MNILLEYEEIILSKIDKIKGVDFSERYVEGAIRYNDELIHYETIRKRQFAKVIQEYKKACNCNELNNVLDYGSGKGYILYLLSKTGLFEKIMGIEILPELCDICNCNINRIGLQQITVVNSDARTFSDIDNYNVFFMFNPFPEKAMKEVICRIDESLKRNFRRIVIIYVNNVHEDLIINIINTIEKKSELINLPRYGCSSAIYANF